MKKWVILATLLVLAGSGTFLALDSDWLRVNAVEIVGEDALSEQEILETAGIARSMSMLELDVKKARERLLAHPRILDATIEKTWPDQVLIRYSIRIPLYSVAYAKRFILVDDTCRVVAVSQDPGGLMTVYGMDIAHFSLGEPLDVYDEQLLEAIEDLVRLVGMSDLNFIPSIHVEGGSIELWIHQEFKADFGDGDAMEEQFNAFYTIYRELAAASVSTGLIDVSTEGLPIYKPFGR